MMISMMAWGAGISLAISGVSYLMGGRRSVDVHHYAPAAPAAAGAPLANRSTGPANPALTRPIFNCTTEEETLRQCLAAGGNCDIYEKRVTECHNREAQGKL